MKLTAIEKFNTLIKNQIALYDGAMGTNLMALGLTSENYGGHLGCHEALNLFSPKVVENIHQSFIEAGCQIIETNTFGATRITLKEYGLEHRVREINIAAVSLVRDAINNARSRGKLPAHRPVLIAGSVGPTSLIPSLAQNGFETMYNAYLEQFEALLDAGVDILQIETCQDLLQIKAALLAAQTLFERRSERCALVVTVTIESNGKMLLGTGIDAVVATLEPYSCVDALGLNCATGPLEMTRHVAYLTERWAKPVLVMPNAGLPENLNGKPFYRMTPEEFAGQMLGFIQDYGVNMVGGCCGTTPQHLSKLYETIRGLKPKTRKIQQDPQVSSLFTSFSLRQKPAPTLVGERTNANGDKQFKAMLLEDDFEGILAIAKEQSRGGAHMLDLCAGYAGRNEVEDLKQLVPMLATKINLPLMIDSTDYYSVKTALERHGGRCIINSVNLEKGEEHLKKTAQLAKAYGAALVCLTIDESGMAKTAHEKLRIAKRLRRILCQDMGFREKDLIIDPLTFTVGSGDKELTTAALETLNAVQSISEQMPEVNILLGVSNVSYGLKKEAREVLNSVFLAEAVSKGLTMAIVNPSRITPMFAIDEEKRRLALSLIYNEQGHTELLMDYMKHFTSAGKTIVAKDKHGLPLPEKLKEKIIEGEQKDLEELVNELLKVRRPEEIIDELVLPTMKKIGEYFGRGETQLPFVLQSAEVVKRVMGLVGPHMKRKTEGTARRLVLATVAGDVHDIGKNLVNIILSNNGYEVHDLGIRVDVDTMISEARRVGANVLAMSGLLVSSTQVMRENLEELNRRRFYPDVVVGGAALTADFVREVLQPAYGGRVFYAQDAVEAVGILEAAAEAKSRGRAAEGPSRRKRELPKPEPELAALANRHQFKEGVIAVEPPFWGNKTADIASSELFGLLSRKVLFEGRWGFKKGVMQEQEYEEMLESRAKPQLAKFIHYEDEHNIFKGRAVYGYYRCVGDGQRIKVLNDLGLVAAEFEFPRQRVAPYLCLADFVGDGGEDVIGLWAVTLGNEVVQRQSLLYKGDEYLDYHLLHGLAAELTDCGAAFVHRVMHLELLREQLVGRVPRGKRYSFGYPACPDLGAQKELLRLLEADKLGLSLTETCQMEPLFSVSGFTIFNDSARYFVP